MDESSGQPEKYIVDRLPEVTEQIRRLVARAKQIGMATQILDTLEAIVSKLESTPLEWGDPEYTTKKSGGLVLHGLLFPLVVKYVVFQEHRVVCILGIRVFPRHPLESE